MNKRQNEDSGPAENAEPDKTPYTKPKLTELGLLRALTQGSF